MLAETIFDLMVADHDKRIKAVPDRPNKMMDFSDTQLSKLTEILPNLVCISKEPEKKTQGEQKAPAPKKGKSDKPFDPSSRFARVDCKRRIVQWTGTNLLCVIADWGFDIPLSKRWQEIAPTTFKLLLEDDHLRAKPPCLNGEKFNLPTLISIIGFVLRYSLQRPDDWVLTIDNGNLDLMDYWKARSVGISSSNEEDWNDIKINIRANIGGVEDPFRHFAAMKDSNDPASRHAAWLSRFLDDSSLPFSKFIIWLCFGGHLDCQAEGVNVKYCGQSGVFASPAHLSPAILKVWRGIERVLKTCKVTTAQQLFDYKKIRIPSAPGEVLAVKQSPLLVDGRFVKKDIATLVGKDFEHLNVASADAVAGQMHSFGASSYLKAHRAAFHMAMIEFMKENNLPLKNYNADFLVVKNSRKNPDGEEEDRGNSESVEMLDSATDTFDFMKRHAFACIKISYGGFQNEKTEPIGSAAEKSENNENEAVDADDSILCKGVHVQYSDDEDDSDTEDTKKRKADEISQDDDGPHCPPMSDWIHEAATYPMPTMVSSPDDYDYVDDDSENQDGKRKKRKVAPCPITVNVNEKALLKMDVNKLSKSNLLRLVKCQTERILLLQEGESLIVAA